MVCWSVDSYFQELNSLLQEGSEVMASGLSRKAVEKYKMALDFIVEHPLEVRTEHFSSRYLI